MEKVEEAELQWPKNGDDDYVEDKVEEVEVDLDADLQPRKPRIQPQLTSDNAPTSPVSNGNYNNGGEVVVNSELVLRSNGGGGAESGDELLEAPIVDDEEELKISTVGVKIDDDVEDINDGVGDEVKGSDQYNVYFDKDQGIWKCRLCSWDFQGRSGLIDNIQCDQEQWHALMNANTINQQRPCFIHETEGIDFNNLREQTKLEHYTPKLSEDGAVDVMLDSFERGNDLISAIDKQNEEHSKHEIVSASSNQSSEISFEEELNNTSFKLSSNKAIEVPDIDLIEDDVTEVTDFDVEAVLKKQETHDLFCPNCNSCITRRVILRKRKRRVRTAEEDSKRNKLESITHPELNVLSNDLASDQAPNEVNVDENLPLLHDYDREREPDIFRCLSCFSFFIPKRDGRSNFWMFGDGSKKETLQDSQKTPVVKKNWFSSIFASTKGTVSSEAGTVHRPDMNNVQAPQNQGDQKDQILSREVPSHSSAGDGVGIQNKSTGTLYPFSQLDDPKSQFSSTQDAAVALGHYQADTLDEMNSHIYSSETPLTDKIDQETTSPSKAPIIIGELVESPIASPHQDGLKLLIPSNVESLVEDLQKDKKANLTLKENADANTILLSSTPASGTRESYVGGKVNSSVHSSSGNGHHVTATLQTESVSVKAENEKLGNKNGGYELSLDHIVHQKVEIHLEKPLRSDKDAVLSSIDDDALLLHDGQNELNKYLNHIAAETNAGKDTIITVEAERVDTSLSHIQETTVVSSRNGALGQTNVAIVGTGNIAREYHSLEIVKSIVYGGLIETITSVGIVSSAVGAHAGTLNVLALGLANLFGGLFLIINDIWHLKSENSSEASDQASVQVDRYQVLLGRRENFLLHSIVAVLSYIIFGLLPPVLYGFLFRKSNNQEFKLLVVGGAAVACIALLAAGKVYVQRPPKSYWKTLSYYIALGFMVSGAAYVAGNLINRFLEKLGIFPTSSGYETGLMEPAWGTLSLPGTTGLMQPAWRS